jgi:hypothetical protein
MPTVLYSSTSLSSHKLITNIHVSRMVRQIKAPVTSVQLRNMMQAVRRPDFWAVFLFTAPYPEQNATKIF